MELEPIYVPSSQLNRVCQRVLGWIFTHRQVEREKYILERLQAHNDAIQRRNKWRALFGMRPRPYMTPQGMEYHIRDEARGLPDPLSHTVHQINGRYGQVESECKDIIIQCAMTDSVAIPQSFARAISHMGINMADLRRPTFGFKP